MLELFRLLVIVFLVMHGLVHVLWFLAGWTSMRTGFGAGAWALPGDYTIRSAVGRLWGIAALAVLGLFVLGATLLALGRPAWISPTNLAVFVSFGVVLPWLRQAPGSVGLTAVLTNLALMFLMALPLAFDMLASG